MPDNGLSLRKQAALAGIPWTTFRRRQAASSSTAATEPELEHDPRPVFGGTLEPPEHRAVARPGQRFVLTSAQNNTDINSGFMDSLECYCAERDAQLLISPFSYDRHSWSQPQRVEADDESLWYHPRVQPYLCNASTRLAPDLLFCGELDILPTATDPLSGLDSYTRQASGIFPHAKLAMKSMATMKNAPPRFLYTTGTVTQLNYIQRKAGQKAEFHHVFGALVVEIDDVGEWFVRQLIADHAGHFQDLRTIYTPTGISHSHVQAVTWGDFHEEKSDPVVHTACFDGADSILETLRPVEQHVHDLADMRARNHHNLKDPYFLAQMRFSFMERVEDDIARCGTKLAAIERPWCRTVVVESNHDQAFKKWLCEADGHRDPPNARYWHYWNYCIFQAIEQRADLFVFESAVRASTQHALANTTFLPEDTSHVILPEHGGIECGLHGHRGPNGSRGSPKGYRQLGVRCNTGHTHSAGIVDGIYTAGVSGEMDMGYNVGPSSWSQSHIVTYPNGKRAIVSMRGAKWHA